MLEALSNCLVSWKQAGAIERHLLGPCHSCRHGMLEAPYAWLHNLGESSLAYASAAM